MAARASRLAYVLLACMTVGAFGGPFAIALVMRGGEQRYWPPDRPVEWWTFLGVTGLVTILMLACLWVAFSNLRAERNAPHRRDAEEAK